ncbi:hypothetical protein ABZ749_30350, partial [Micromonospora sp. NPDC047753]
SLGSTAFAIASPGRTTQPPPALPSESIAPVLLDFSELALRVEDETGEELNFDAPGLRRIATVGDVLDFLVELQHQ